MSESVLFPMNADRGAYLVKREAELAATNPYLYDAMRLDELMPDQKTALLHALDILATPRQLSKAAVANSPAEPSLLREESRYIDSVRWAQAISPVACMVGGAKERRDAVRSRICLALRATRLASSQ